MRIKSIGFGAVVATIACGLALPASASADTAFGYSDNSHSEADIDPALAATMAAASGAEVTRFSVHWGTVQCCSQARFEWRPYDKFVEAIRAEGLIPLPVFVGTPWWARAPLCFGSTCPPANHRRVAFAEFVRAGVSRWHQPGQGLPLAGIQIWNEPNHGGSWHSLFGPSGSDYGALFNTVAVIVGQETDELPLIVAGLDGRSPNDVFLRYQSIPTFLRQFYNSGALRYLDPQDRLAAHPYVKRYEAIMSETRRMRDARDPDRRLWITETGSTTGPGGVSPQVQAQEIVAALEDLDQAQDVDLALVHTLFEVGYRPDEAGLGVVARTADGVRPKPAYCAISTAQGMLSPTGC